MASNARTTDSVGDEGRPRHAIARALEQAEHALAAADSAQARAQARVALALAYAARAEDSRHGAGQLSLSAQRAPTLSDCDDGWRRVEAIVRVAEAAARASAALVVELEGDARPSVLSRARAAARRAEAAARDARKLVDERNHAYTFHAADGFSFGEGWYVAAAAVLAGVAVQVEPGHPNTPGAERFLREAGLGEQLRGYRSRPRAMKQTTAIVAHAFRQDAVAAQRKLRAAFLGEAPIAAPIVQWADSKLSAAPARRKVLLWVRKGVHHTHRNTSASELQEITRQVLDIGLVPIAVGDAAPAPGLLEGTVDLTLFWKEPLFRGTDSRRAQLHLFEHLAGRHGVVGQLGVTTAGMDGPALMGLPSAYLTSETNPRMRAWVGAVPGYRGIVRDEAYGPRICATLTEWASAGRPAPLQSWTADP